MTILITGGMSGLGRAITAALASDDAARLIVTYHRSAEEAERMGAAHPNIRSVKCDFGSETEIGQLLEIIERENIDVVINNAFTGFRKEHFFKTEATYFLQSFSANVLSTLRITQKAIHVFRKKNFGKIITILSSAIVNKPPTGWAAYVAEKNYLLSMAKSWAVENARFNVTSNMVSPSFMLTDLNRGMDERLVEDARAKLPLKEFLKPEETAEAVRFLVYCSQQINGNNIIINQAEDLI
jgi:NAD(P)-dependent dehydrogenase (short-subunit alcohol dehydrogenase family)